MKLDWLVILFLSSAFPTLAQQPAESSQPSLKGETLTAKPQTHVLFAIKPKGCVLLKPFDVEGKATTEPLPGDLSGTVKNLFAQRGQTNGEFDAKFVVTTSAGQLTIQNTGYEQGTPPDCGGQGLPGAGGAQQRHFVFEFVTQYDATLPQDGHHVCGEATVSGRLGWATGRGIKQTLSETLGPGKPCPSTK